MHWLSEFYYFTWVGVQSIAFSVYVCLSVWHITKTSDENNAIRYVGPYFRFLDNVTYSHKWGQWDRIMIRWVHQMAAPGVKFAVYDCLVTGVFVLYDCWKSFEVVGFTKKGKGFIYSLPGIGLRADPGVLEVSPQQVTISHPPVVGCHYIPPGMRLPSQTERITALWPVPSYTVWWQRHIGVNNLPKVVMQLLPQVGFEPTTCWSQVQHSTRCAKVGFITVW